MGEKEQKKYAHSRLSPGWLIGKPSPSFALQDCSFEFVTSYTISNTCNSSMYPMNPNFEQSPCKESRFSSHVQMSTKLFECAENQPRHFSRDCASLTRRENGEVWIRYNNDGRHYRACHCHCHFPACPHRPDKLDIQLEIFRLRGCCSETYRPD